MINSIIYSNRMTEVKKIIQSVENSDSKMKPRRHRLKWSIKETLDLEREYTLLHMSFEEIADKHQRTVESIILKLEEMKDEIEFDIREEFQINYKSEKNKLYDDYSIKYNNINKKYNNVWYKTGRLSETNLSSFYYEQYDLNTIYDNDLENINKKYLNLFQLLKTTTPIVIKD